MVLVPKVLVRAFFMRESLGYIDEPEADWMRAKS